MRLYKNNEMIKGLGFTYEVLEESLEKICDNSESIKKGLEWLKSEYNNRMIDYKGLLNVGMYLLKFSQDYKVIPYD